VGILMESGDLQGEGSRDLARPIAGQKVKNRICPNTYGWHDCPIFAGAIELYEYIRDT